jgi:histone acetyltransferase MYST1
VKYYVHYEDFNRRMDEWIDSTRIDELPSVANAVMREKRQLLEMSSLNPETYEPLLKRRKSDLEGDQGDGEAGEGEDSELFTDDHPPPRPRSHHDYSSLITTIHDNEHDEHEGMDENQLREHEEITKVKNVRNVIFGRYDIECWYYSPFPKEFTPDGPVDYLFFDEFSFRFFKTKNELICYQQKPILRHPPGNEIYRDDEVSMFEVDGAVERFYCQNLSYFAKLFLDHKTLYYDVDPFLFYVLCSRDDRGFHPVGYFSKEKYVTCPSSSHRS